MNHKSRATEPYLVYQASRILARLMVVGELLPKDYADFFINFLRELLRGDVGGLCR